MAAATSPAATAAEAAARPPAATSSTATSNRSPATAHHNHFQHHCDNHLKAAMTTAALRSDWMGAGRLPADRGKHFNTPSDTSMLHTRRMRAAQAIILTISVNQCSIHQGDTLMPVEQNPCLAITSCSLSIAHAAGR